MAIADTSRSILRYVEESTWGTTPASALNEMRFTGESLGYNPVSETSAEIRSDRQITDSIRVDAEPGGSVNFELSYDALDSFFKSALFSTWGTTVAVAGTDIAAATSGNKYTSTTTDFTTENLTVGQWIEVRGFTDPANNGYAQVVSFTATELVVSGLTLVTEAAGDSVTMGGTNIRNGTTALSYTLEKEFSDITQFISFTGMMVNALSLSVASGAIVTGSLDFVGKDAARGVSTVGTGSAVAAPTKDVINSVSNIGELRESGALMSASGVYVQSVDINVDNGLRGQKAVGNLGNIGIGDGRCNVTGTLNAYFVDGALYDKLINNTATSLSFKLEDGAGNAYIVTLPNIKFQAGNPEITGADADVFLSLDFQALRDSTNNYTIQIDKFAA